MFRDILDTIKEILVRFVSSRLFALALVFVVLFSVLSVRLFQLQIIDGEKYLEEYEDKTLTEVTTVGTRGNIYDRDGNLLAYNQLQYNITIADNGAYDTSNDGINARNNMLRDLALIIEKYGYKVEGQYRITLNEAHEFEFTTNSDEDRRRFIAAVRGKKQADLKPQYLNMTAEEVVEYSKRRYRFDNIWDSNKNPIVLPDDTLLDMINIFYTLRLTSYQRYQVTTIVKNISKECKAEILEAKGHLQGVDIENVSVRKYNYAPYLSHIVGYTGQLREAQLADLKKNDESYELNDNVGVWGLEKSMEAELKGQKGRKTMYLNSVGSIMKVVSETEARSGRDVYTTISANDQIAIYHLLELELAGILATKITEEDEVNKSTTKQSEIMIPVKDAYFQLINNNILQQSHFTAEDSGPAEKQIQDVFESKKEATLKRIREQLLHPDGNGLKDLPQDMQSFVVYIYEYLTGKESGFIKTNDPNYRQSEAFIRWRQDTISLRELILMGIEESWLNISVLNLSEDYYETDNIYSIFVNEIIDILRHDRKFDKLLYKYAISDKTIPGYMLLMAAIEQHILPEDSEAYIRLSSGDEHYAYQYLIYNIQTLKLKPSQLALDPCNGSVTVVDVKTGKIRALVTYPGFDNNRITNAQYLQKCNEDLSLPLLNCATQTQLAPGSTFKPITSVAAMEEHALDLYTLIDCTGRYEEVTPNIRCWIYPSRHGTENIVDGLKNSCNYFFADLGHRLAEDKDHVYTPSAGIEVIHKWAAAFGLDRLSGVEIDEAQPRISDYDPERSAMGQGNHAFNNVQLSRYITAVANNGTLFDLSIVDRVSDPDGTLIKRIEPKIAGHLELSQETWSAVHTGLRRMITEGVGKAVFLHQNIPVAGKTGTAQEREDRGNHAVFVSYAPYNDPEISVTVNIPYGYSSGNAANLANMVYNYCYGKDSLDAILGRDASSIGSVNVSD